MSVAFPNQIAENPYASPRATPAPAPAAPAADTRPGSLVLILLGFVLVLVGYFTSNFFLISDLYHVGFGPGGKEIPSPFAPVFNTPALQWMLYLASASAFVAGAVMIGSQRFNPLAVVAYIMCPLIGIIHLLGAPLRIAKKYAEAVAAVYLLIGSALAFTGATQMFRLYGLADPGIAPVGASLLTEVGLAFVVGAALKFCCTPPSSACPAGNVVVAELNEAAAGV
jgi:hypothetical protein